MNLADAHKEIATDPVLSDAMTGCSNEYRHAVFTAVAYVISKLTRRLDGLEFREGNHKLAFDAIHKLQGQVGELQLQVQKLETGKRDDEPEETPPTVESFALTRDAGDLIREYIRTGGTAEYHLAVDKWVQNWGKELDVAGGLIANAWGGDWDKAPKGWVERARAWQERWSEVVNRGKEPKASCPVDNKTQLRSLSEQLRRWADKRDAYFAFWTPEQRKSMDGETARLREVADELERTPSGLPHALCDELAQLRALRDRVAFRLDCAAFPRSTKTDPVDNFDERFNFVMQRYNAKTEKINRLESTLDEIVGYASTEDCLTITDKPEKCALSLVNAMVHNRDLQIARLEKERDDYRKSRDRLVEDYATLMKEHQEVDQQRNQCRDEIDRINQDLRGLLIAYGTTPGTGDPLTKVRDSLADKSKQLREAKEKQGAIDISDLSKEQQDDIRQRVQRLVRGYRKTT